MRDPNYLRLGGAPSPFDGIQGFVCSIQSYLQYSRRAPLVEELKAEEIDLSHYLECTILYLVSSNYLEKPTVAYLANCIIYIVACLNKII